MRRAALALLVLFAGRLAAQDRAPDVRTLHVSRTLIAAPLMHVNVKYGAGTLTLKPASTPVLYDVRMSYQADQSSPLANYDLSTHSLDVGIKDGAFHNVNFDSTGGFLQLNLAPGVPVDLSLKIGAAQATLNLGGLSVHSLMLKGGATQTTVTFDSANLIPMESMTMEVGAAQFEAHGLANARAKNMTIAGAAGQIELWFDGTWTNDVTLRSKIFLGEMKIHVPADVKVVSTAKAILGSVTNESNDTANAKSDDSDSSDMDMSDSSDDSDDSDSSSSASVQARVEAAQARVEAAKAREEAAKARAASARDMAQSAHDMAQSAQDMARSAKDMAQGQKQVQPRHTLYITGSATAGALEIVRDAPVAASH